MGTHLKAVVFSDLHIRYSGPLDYDLGELPADADVVIVAGDVTDPLAETVRWLHEHVAIKGFEVVAVAGNHEYYGQVYEETLAEGLEACARYPGVHLLENGEVTIKGVRFLGATLWTDFELIGDPAGGVNAAYNFMNDYRMIRSKDPGGLARRWRPEMTRDIHLHSRQWLRDSLARPHRGPTVVVTHHCPHPMSIAEQYRGDVLNSSFTSNMDAEIREFQPDFWIHGHTHACFDYVVPGTRTRVVCNPRGYVREHYNGYSVENPQFERFKTIDIPVAP